MCIYMYIYVYMKTHYLKVDCHKLKMNTLNCKATIKNKNKKTKRYN